LPRSGLAAEYKWWGKVRKLKPTVDFSLKRENIQAEILIWFADYVEVLINVADLQWKHADLVPVLTSAAKLGACGTVQVILAVMPPRTWPYDILYPAMNAAASVGKQRGPLAMFNCCLVCGFTLLWLLLTVGKQRGLAVY
jgi:hypothetical protein